MTDPVDTWASSGGRAQVSPCPDGSRRVRVRLISSDGHTQAGDFTLTEAIDLSAAIEAVALTLADDK